MRRVARRAFLLAALAPLATFGAVGLSGPAAAGPVAALRVPAQYQVINLGSLGGGGSGTATALNDRGDAVGYSLAPNGFMHPFLWRHGVMTDLGVLEPGRAEFSVAADINNRDEIVGSGDVANGSTMHGFLWRRGVLTDLGTLGGAFSAAEAINDRGQIVGTSSTAAGEWHAFLWENGHLTDLGVASISGINNRGQMVGGTSFPAGFHGYLMDRGTVADLGVLPGGSYSNANAINAHGWVVGDSDSAAHPGNAGAYLWRGGAMRELPGLDGTYSTTTALNDRGQVLGESQSSGRLRPVLWQNATVIDLTTRGIVSSGAGEGAGPLHDINNAGWIAGSVYLTDGQLGPALYV